ncbi:disco-interacting protein 2 homolog C-like [Trachypithecus francoisi]|uniref:disco-interacting protein 2 homolog C-like n=1 Tax=Trachypithecus francoisi TaxID=54180 RepID=UPI00141B6BEB|nr:disco-interacting protein 2 homolog C-like [Trachypithecus francoisi]
MTSFSWTQSSSSWNWVDQALLQELQAPVTPSSASCYHCRRSSGSRDEHYQSDLHTEAVQAALAKHKERKMVVPMPSKCRSLVVQASMDTYTPSGKKEEFVALWVELDFSSD